MNNLHQDLLDKYPGYKKWHESALHTGLHWLVLIIVPLFIFGHMVKTVNETMSNLAAVQTAENRVEAVRLALSKLRVQSEKSPDIVRGKAKMIETFEETNSYGDQLIMTRVTIAVNESFKGSQAAEFKLDMVGGTLDDVTMASSEEPTPLLIDEEAILFVKKDNIGRYKLVDGERSLYRLKGGVSAELGDMSLDQIRTIINSHK